MSISRITISVAKPVARRIKKAAGSMPVSTWIAEVIDQHLDEADLERRWQDFCREVSPTQANVRRADAMFNRLTKARRHRSAA